ncbi:MAG TPA: carboxypeptidase-like regulatory domain-containing protein, partial [Candidatus Angelobacter sp.]|nr:carboxypeptidase-like regulatory domain-containing protein [Candidatus Angelobacter sp.]
MKDKAVHTAKSTGFRQCLLTPAAILCVCLLASVSITAQVTTADVLGTVTDNSGAVVPNAKVTITNTATNEPRSGQTGSSGDYVFTFLN